MAKKILLADDSITIQKVIELTFSDEDFEVITAGNGRVALERLPEVRPDIVLCDIIMPEKDGYEVCEQIKANPSWAQIPVLLLTGAFEPFDQERAAKAGYDGSLAKPFEPETLIAKVKELLARAPRPATPPPPLPPGVRSAAPAAAGPGAGQAPPPVVAPPHRATAAGTTPVAYIPEEPFSGLDEAAFASPARAGRAPALAGLSEDESASLSGAPEVEDTASTVMFRAKDVPPAPVPAPRPVAAPAMPPAAKGPAAPPAFEAVIEEDLDFGPGDYAAPAPRMPLSEEGPRGAFDAVMRGETGAGWDRAADTAAFPEGASGQKGGVRSPQPEIVEATPVAEAPVLATVPEGLARNRPDRPAHDAPAGPAAAPRSAAPEPMRPAPRPPVEPLLPRPTAAPAGPTIDVTQPPMRSKVEPARTLLEPAPVVRHEAPAARPAVMAPPAPPAAKAAASFAEVGRALVQPAEAPRASEAGEIPIPLEMVEKIAQRVIAQISEKVVREIAWEVLPDLAETLIKREIDRLKAELAKM